MKKISTLIIILLALTGITNAQTRRVTVTDSLTKQEASIIRNRKVDTTAYGDTAIYKLNYMLLLKAQVVAARHNYLKAANIYMQARRCVYSFESVAYLNEAACRMLAGQYNPKEGIALMNAGLVPLLKRHFEYAELKQRYHENLFLAYHNIRMYDSAYVNMFLSSEVFLSRHLEAVINTLMRIGKEKDAVDFARQYLDEDVKLTANYYYLTAMANLLSGDTATALLCVYKSIDIKPTSNAYALIGNLKFRSEPVEAYNAFFKAYRIEKTTVNAINLAKCALYGGNAKKAVDVLQPIWKANKSSEVGLLLFAAQNECRLYSKSHLTMQQVERLHKKDLPDNFYFEKAALLVNEFCNEKGKKDSVKLKIAEDCFLKQISIDDEPEAYVGLAIISFLNEDFLSAKVYFEKLEQQYTNYEYSIYGLFLRSLTACYWGKEEEIKSLLENISARKSAIWYAIEAMRYFYLNDLDRAEISAKRCLRMERDNLFGKMMMAAILYQQGENAKAEAAYDNILRLNPDLTEAKSGWALAASRNGKSELSLKVFADLITEHPTSRYFQNFALCLYYAGLEAKVRGDMGSVDKFSIYALNLLAKAEEINPDKKESYRNNMAAIHLLREDEVCFREMGLNTPAAKNNLAVHLYSKNKIENTEKCMALVGEAINDDLKTHAKAFYAYTENERIFIGRINEPGLRVLYYSIYPVVLKTHQEYRRFYIPVMPSYQAYDGEYELYMIKD